MSRNFGHIAILGLIVLLASCNDKLTCPAYTSYFILDNSNADMVASAKRGDMPDPSYLLRENDIRDKYFSYVGEDSMPRTDMYTPQKDQFGIIKKPGFLAKRNDLKMIPMDVVIPEADDSVKFQGDAEFLTELDNVDSTATAGIPDSVATDVKTYKYNIDQKYYLWYLREKLVWKDELGQEDEPASSATDVENLEEKPKEGFFKRTFGNLFKKKEKPEDPATVAPTEENEEEDPEGFNP